MAPTFEPLEPYTVDDSDAITIGHLRHAASRGDRRARLTLRGIDQRRREARDAAEQNHPNAGAIARGRQHYTDEQDKKTRKRDPRATDGAA
jgi:hypothetical protein